MFQIKNKIKACEMSIMSTTEGIYLSDDEKAKSIEQLNLEYQNSFHLLLGDFDLKNYKIFQLITNLVRNIQKEQCNMKNLIMQNFENRINSS